MFPGDVPALRPWGIFWLVIAQVPCNGGSGRVEGGAATVTVLLYISLFSLLREVDI